MHSLFSSFLYAGGPSCVFCVILCFAPYFLYSHHWHAPTGNEPINDALQSLLYQYSLVATVAASTLPLIEITADMINSRGNLSTRTLIICSILFCLIFPELIMLKFSITSNSYAKLYLCISNASTIAYMFAGCMLLCQCSQTIWRTKWCAFSATCLNFGYVSLSFPPYFETSLVLKLSINYCGIFLIFLGCSVFLFLSYKFLNTKIPDDRNNVHAIADDLICRFGTVFIDFVIFGKFALSFATGIPYWTDYTAVHISLDVFISSVPSLGMCFAFSRATKNEAYFMQNVRQKFVRYISHEMRTPLNTAVMGLQYLRSELVKSHINTELLGIVDEVRGACEISVTILNEMLDYDKLQSGIMKLEKEDIYVKTFLESTISPFYAQANHKGIDLKFELKDSCFDTLQMEVDKNKFAQVIRNLISNGIKFTPTGGIVKVVTTVIEKKLQQSSVVGVVATSIDSKNSKLLRIDVIDSGVGVSKENQKKLFKEIIQFNPGKLQSGGGSGLGLYISKGIMDLHQGDLTVTSEGEGFGCIFTITIQTKCQSVVATYGAANECKDSNDNLSSSSRYSRSPWLNGLFSLDGFRTRSSFSLSKLAPNENKCHPFPANKQYQDINDDECRNFSEPFIESTVDELPTRPPLSTTSLRILVVDDSTSNRKMLMRLLKDRCTDISEAVDGLEAVNKIKDAMAVTDSKGNNTPITTSNDQKAPPYDVVLMDFIMPNMEGPEAARCMREVGYRGLIIGITGNMLPVDKERYLNDGANIVLTKPVNIQDIENALQLLENNKTRARIYGLQ